MKDNLVRADLVITCPHLGDGGAQAVAVRLANTWVREGRRILFITLFEEDPVYTLHPSIRHTVIRRPDRRKIGLPRVVRRLAERALPRLYGLLRDLRRSVRERLHSSARIMLDRYRNDRMVLLFDRIRIYKSMRWRVKLLRRDLRRTDAPVVLAFCTSTNVMTLLASEGLGKRIIVCERNDPDLQKLPHSHAMLRQKLYETADQVTANTRGAIASLSAYVHPDRLMYIPNAIDAEHTSPTFNTHRGPALLIVGRLHPQKAHDVLLDAFARLPASLSHWRLQVVGRGDLEICLKRRAVELGIADRVEWHGQVENPYTFYRAASIFALPSRHEGMPNALLEAMSCGMAVIVSDASPGPLELVDHEASGLVVPAEDPVALSHALERLMTTPTLRIHLGRAAQHRAAALDFSVIRGVWDQVVGWPPTGQRQAAQSRLSPEPVHA